MSTILIAKKDGMAAIAADSMFSIGSLSIPASFKVNHHKIRAVHDCYIANVGWCAMDNILEDLILTAPDQLDFSDRSSIFQTLLKIQSCLEEKYFINTSEDSDQPVDSNQLDGLAISPKGIFDYTSYRNINEYSKFWASGSGRDYALGAMNHAYEGETSAEEVVIAGMKAACTFDDASDSPYYIQQIALV